MSDPLDIVVTAQPSDAGTPPGPGHSGPQRNDSQEDRYNAGTRLTGDAAKAAQDALTDKLLADGSYDSVGNKTSYIFVPSMGGVIKKDDGFEMHSIPTDAEKAAIAKRHLNILTGEEITPPASSAQTGDTSTNSHKPLDDGQKDKLASALKSHKYGEAQKLLAAAGYGDVLAAHGEKNGGVDNRYGKDTFAAAKEALGGALPQDVAAALPPTSGVKLKTQIREV